MASTDPILTEEPPRTQGRALTCPHCNTFAVPIIDDGVLRLGFHEVAYGRECPLSLVPIEDIRTQSAASIRLRDAATDLLAALEKARKQLHNAHLMDGLHSLHLGCDGAAERANSEVAYIDAAIAKARGLNLPQPIPASVTDELDASIERLERFAAEFTPSPETVAKIEDYNAKVLADFTREVLG